MRQRVVVVTFLISVLASTGLVLGYSRLSQHHYTAALDQLIEHLQHR